MLVITEDLFGSPGVDDGKPSATHANPAQFFTELRSSRASSFPVNALPERPDHCLRKAFSCHCNQFPSEAIGFRTLDAQGHFHIPF